ncbi:MAG: hypothetical protein N2662_00345 [Bacteroidales bacterium]|nr:hypothetical protein [Bacteroidales bacterium]
MYLARNNERTLLVDLAFIDYPGWFGGKARSVQLKELIEEKGYRFEKTELPKPNKLQVIIFGLKYLFRYGYYKPFGYRSLVNSAYLYYGYTEMLKRYPEIAIVIKEGTGHGDLVIANIIKQFKRKIYFIPANIESLCEYPGDWTHKISKIKRFREELRYFKKADAIFCISEEDAWILRVFGCNAHLLPYFPPKVIMPVIEKRRLNRNPDENFGLFSFGMLNRPFIDGLKSLFDLIKTNRFKLPYKLKIAGKGTEYLKNFAADIPEIEILGELTDEELEECLSKCVAVFFYHAPTSGMITRVPEMILSGIPIIGNEDALKDYILKEGTYHYLCTETKYFHDESLKEKYSMFKKNLFSFI